MRSAGMTSASWQNKMALAFVSPSIPIKLASYHRQSAFVETICQRTEKASHPPISKVLCIQTWVPAVDRAVAWELVPVPLGCSQSPGKYCFGQSLQAFVAVQVSRDVSAQHWRKKCEW